MSKIMEEFLKLSDEEQRTVAEEINSFLWGQSTNESLTVEQEAMLKKRLENANRYPEDSYSWDEVRAQIKQRK